MLEPDAAAEGSPPRIRGKPERFRFGVNPQGLIPAHTGKTTYPASSPSRNRAHPRAYGENVVGDRNATTQTGSSPRIRGKRADSNEEGTVSGLIPAHTGKTRRLPRRAQPPGAHPRAYGENLAFISSGRSFRGSPPRIRGKRRLTERHELQVGLIPAHTGKTYPQ